VGYQALVVQWAAANQEAEQDQELALPALEAELSHHTQLAHVPLASDVLEKRSPALGTS